jgi:hypothetical protein
LLQLFRALALPQKAQDAESDMVVNNFRGLCEKLALRWEKPFVCGVGTRTHFVVAVDRLMQYKFVRKGFTPTKRKFLSLFTATPQHSATHVEQLVTGLIFVQKDRQFVPET